jgi:HlyD family secretion protein
MTKRANRASGLPASQGRAVVAADGGDTPAIRGGASDRRLDQLPVAATSAYGDLRKTARLGFIASAIILVAAGALLSQTVIAGAVVTHGTLVVETGPKKVQHPKGGIVAKLLVNEDDVVRAGQPLLVLDQTVDQAKLKSTATALAQQRIRLVRLQGERDGLDALSFPPFDHAMAIPEAEYRTMVSSETRQFDLGVAARDGQRSQLGQRVAQTEQQLAGDQSQLDATTAQIDVVQKEVKDLRDLFAKQLVGYQRVSEMERTLSQLLGAASSLRASIAEGGGKIAELKLQIIQVDQDLRAQLTDQLAQVQTSIAELAEQLVVAKDDLARAVITAPIDGAVHELSVHTIGGVVQPAETLMLIVPDHDRLVGEVKLGPADIDQLYPGQDVAIHFTAFDRGTTPSLDGRLASISPDLVQDQRTGAMYYTGRIETTDAELGKLADDNLKLVPGMPIDAFIKTDSRTILSYLLKPLTDQAERAFR